MNRMILSIGCSIAIMIALFVVPIWPQPAKPAEPAVEPIEPVVMSMIAIDRKTNKTMNYTSACWGICPNETEFYKEVLSRGYDSWDDLNQPINTSGNWTWT